MSEARLASHIEASALLARARATGGFGTVLRKGDLERGALVLVVLERGTMHALLERRLQPSGDYGWEARPVTDSQAIDQHLARAGRNDPDTWILELDVPSAERFIVETTSPT